MVDVCDLVPEKQLYIGSCSLQFELTDQASDQSPSSIEIL